MVSPLIRVRDWRGRLRDALAHAGAQPFAWGSHDCLTGLVGPAVLAMTDTDCTFAWRGRYTTILGAARVMNSDGFADLADLIGSVLPEIHPSQAGSGDVAAIPTHDAFGFALGIVTGPTVAVLSPTGLAAMPRAAMTRAFKV